MGFERGVEGGRFCTHTRRRSERTHGDADHPPRNTIANRSGAEAQHNEA